jgi:hypothetical protein
MLARWYNIVINSYNKSDGARSLLQSAIARSLTIPDGKKGDLRVTSPPSEIPNKTLSFFINIEVSLSFSSLNTHFTSSVNRLKKEKRQQKKQGGKRLKFNPSPTLLIITAFLFFHKISQVTNP